MNADRIKIDIEQFNQALLRLDEALKETPEENLLWLDGTIQRFEFCYELAWKTLKRVLFDQGVETTTPQDVLKKAYKYKLIDNEKIWIDMKNDRNLTVHTYKEALALEIYGRIKTYYKEMRVLADQLIKTL